MRPLYRAGQQDTCTVRSQPVNEKVCYAQELGSYAQGQGGNQVKGQIVPKIVLLINY